MEKRKTRHQPKGQVTMEQMRNQRDRDTVTLEISTTLLIFVLVVAVGAVPMFLVYRFIGDGAALQVLGAVVVASATGVAIVYLWRHRRP